MPQQRKGRRVKNKIHLTGTVGTGFWDEDYFSAADVRAQIDGLEGDLDVYLNSGGGIATEGQAIYSMLKAYDGVVTIIIEGIAASAASLIAMAGDEIVMPLGSVLMIHDPATWGVAGRGTEEDHIETAKGLAVIAGAYAAVYADRAGITVEEAREIMKAETYFDGPSAVEAGFATRTDEALEAVTAAAFDYRLYAKAPKTLRAQSGSLPRRSAPSVLAMLAGASISSHSEGNPMKPKKPKAARTTASQINEVEALEEDELEGGEALEEEDLDGDGEETEAEEEIEAEGEEEEIEANLEDPETARAASILRFTASRGVDASKVAGYITAGLTLKQVMTLHKKGTPMSKPRPTMSRARIVRDERDTRRAGMSEALHAQMTRKASVSVAARPYMGMSIAAIAASASGQSRVSLRSWGDREAVLMDASHSTSDFPGIFKNALNKVLLDQYGAFEPTYRRVSRAETFRDFRPMPLIREGDFPMLKAIGEGGEIKSGTFGETDEVAMIVPFGRKIQISRQMLINDELGAIARLMSSYGRMIATFEEQTFYQFALAARLADGNSVFHTTRRNIATAGTGITREALSEARAAIRKQKSVDGMLLGLTPNILLVGPEMETEAEAIVAAITPTSVSEYNPFSGKLEVVTTAAITGNEWFVLSEAAPCFVHGFLEGAEAPRVRTDEPFGTQGMSMSIEHDFGFGAADGVGGYKNPGL